MGEKAKKVKPEERKRLNGLEFAHPLRAKQIAENDDQYAKALSYLKHGFSHFAGNGADLPTMVKALVKNLAAAGMDADAIRAMKPYVRRFTSEVLSGKETFMHQAAARYWNQIAESQPLKTEWAQQMFPLPQEDMDLALANEEKRLIRETSNPVLAAAYLKIMPLLWENAAISTYLKDNPSQKAAIPPIENIAEAIMIASKDFRLTTRELMKVGEMLEEPPTPNRALSVANAVISDYKAASRKRLRYPDRDEMPRIAEALFRPSFDAETLLRVIADSDGTIMELTSAEHMIAHPFTHKNIVAPNYALRFWTEMDAMLAAPFNIEKTFGLDGITIKVDCRTPAGGANFEVWSPKSRTQAGRLIGLIYDVAREASSFTPAVECLERLDSFLRY
ncbi:hypothetical protein [Bradyrhizobium sp. F1.13.3]|uniref:hypothetical protein n=1 Tax=Bradyrhizobium sp. F1.13.3 TaxID=3156351 RepID=UPI00339AA13F